MSGTADRLRHCQLSLPVSVTVQGRSKDGHGTTVIEATSKKCFDYHMMWCGIFSMLWPSESCGSVSGSWDFCSVLSRSDWLGRTSL